MDQSSVAGSMWPSTLLPSSMDDVERDMDVKRLLAFQANATSTTSSKVLECEPTGHLAEGAATTTLDPGTILTTNLQSSNPQSLRIDYRQQTTQHEVNCGKSSIGSRCLELSSQPHFSSSIPSPLASPITATAASLTALSISHSNNSVSQALYTRDLTKVTGPHRGHKNQIQNAIIQSYRRNEYREVAPQEQLGMSSDPETSAQSASRHVSSHKLAAKEASLSTIRRRAESSTSSATVNRTAKSTPPLRVTLHNLVSTGYLPADTRVIFRDYSATVTARGTLIPIYTEDNWATLFPWLQGEYETPSAWATAMVKGARTGKVAVNGWSAIKVKIQQHSALAEMFSGQGSPEVSLDVLRKRYLTDMVYHGSAQAETESAMGDAGKGGTLVDRKKRKRRSAKAAEGLRISTNRCSTPIANTHRRKRTVSDVSGMVTARAAGALRLDLEAAGVLFAMQDGTPLTPSHDQISVTTSCGQRAGGRGSDRLISVIQLQSLMAYREEKKRRMRRLSGSLLPALRAVVVMKLHAHDAFEHDLGQQQQCHICRSVMDASESAFLPTNDAIKPEEPTEVRVCTECKDSYHLRCLPRDHLCELTTTSWKCPRCIPCSLCHISVFKPPAIATGASDTEGQKDHDSKESTAISILFCNQCQTTSHLQCQIARDFSIKGLFTAPSTAKHDIPDWICPDCRKCVECGVHGVAGGPTTGPSVPDDDDLNEGSPALKDPPTKTDTGWSQEFALCPECTQLAGKGNICPLCCCIYRDDDYETPMIFCDGCNHWVHVACDKGLEEGDYEELGQDSKQYFCPACSLISPTHSSSSSMVSAFNSVDQSPWEALYGHYSLRCDHQGERSFSENEDQWFEQPNRRRRNSKRRDDILDLIKAAKEISDVENRANQGCSHPSAPSTPPSPCSPVFPSFLGTHSRRVSASLESVTDVAEVVAAEALLTIFSGMNTPVQSSTPYASYPPSPFEGPMFYDYRHQTVFSSPNDPSTSSASKDEYPHGLF